MPELRSQTDIQERVREVGGAELYGPASVLITEADAAHNSVRFLVGATEVKCDWTADFVWAGQPGSLACSDTSLPEVHDAGVLYLSERLVEQCRLSAITIKWPDALPEAPEYREVTVWPTAMTFRGVEVPARPEGGCAGAGGGSGGPTAVTLPEVTIDLTDPSLAEPGQRLALDGKPMTLRLSQAGFQKLFKTW